MASRARADYFFRDCWQRNMVFLAPNAGEKYFPNAAPLSSRLSATFVRAHCSAAPSLSFVSGMQKVIEELDRASR